MPDPTPEATRNTDIGNADNGHNDSLLIVRCCHLSPIAIRGRHPRHLSAPRGVLPPVAEHRIAWDLLPYAIGRDDANVLTDRPPTSQRVSQALDDMRELYLSDQKPWIVGFSGGKDSTTVLQLVYRMLEALPPDKRTKTVYVISSDTLVENPVIAAYLDETIETIRAGVRSSALPIVVEKVVPEIANTFWVTLIGKGYPAPSRFFRWCTDRLKIDPTARFIKDRVDEYGAVVVLLGARKAESSTRSQVLENYKIPGSDLRRHATMPNAFIYPPIADWDTHDVWTYLLSWEAPWAPSLRHNSRLRDLYRDAASGECPLVIDRSTPSCGQSRFGCWTCTVVSSDFSMESFIETGSQYSWMKPLLDFRNKLKTYRDDPTKREKWRRTDDGRPTGYEDPQPQVLVEDTAEQKAEVLGPLTLEVRKELLEELLALQKSTGYRLLSEDELSLIRQHWTRDYRVSEQALTDILERVYGPTTRHEQRMKMRDLLEVVCQHRGVDVLLVDRLADLERGYLSRLRRRGLFEALDDLLDEWSVGEDRETDAD